jgi:Tfp pilus assembly protein PilX
MSLKKGFALITVLAVMIMIALGTATILQSMGSVSNLKNNNIREVQAQYLAEAGMQWALWRCRQAGGCSAQTINVPVEDNFGRAGGTAPVVITLGALLGGVQQINVRVDYPDA